MLSLPPTWTGLLNFSFIHKSFLTPSTIHLHQVQGSHNGHLVKVIFSYSYVIHNTFTSGGTMPQWISFEICQSSHGGLRAVLAPSILLLYQAQGNHTPQSHLYVPHGLKSCSYSIYNTFKALPCALLPSVSEQGYLQGVSLY